MFTRRRNTALTQPETLHCLTHENRVLHGTTRCGGVPVKIFKNADSRLCKDFDGNTMWRRGVMHVDLAARLFDKKHGERLAAVLLHEFTHVIEYCNSQEFLSAATNSDNCTELAQAMEEGLGEIYKHLKGINFVFPARAGPKPAPRKRKQKP